jgi:hypothetical protein
VLEFLIDVLVGWIPNRWDGKSLPKKETLRSSFRVTSGSVPRVSGRWAAYSTTVAESSMQ